MRKTYLYVFLCVIVFSVVVIGENIKQKPLLIGEKVLPSKTVEKNSQPPILSQTDSQDMFQNAERAIMTAKKARMYFSPGKVWTMSAPDGRVEVKAAILYQGRVVSILNFSGPQGKLLLSSDKATNLLDSNELVEKAKVLLPQIIKNIDVLNGVDFLEPENAWAVPLVYKNIIVGRIKIHIDGVYVLPDYPAEQEMMMFTK